MGNERKEKLYQEYKDKEIDVFDIVCPLPQFFIYCSRSFFLPATVDINKYLHPIINENVHKRINMGYTNLFLLQKLAVFQNGKLLIQWKEDDLERYNSRINQRIRKYYSGETPIYNQREGSYMIYQNAYPKEFADYIDTFDEVCQIALDESSKFPDNLLLVSRIIEDENWH